MPVENETALLLENDERVLIVADLHIGLENQFTGKGLYFPSQTPLMENTLEKLIREYTPSTLILLGDVKHTVPNICIQEWKEIPHLLKRLGKLIKIEIVPGNHDSSLKRLIPKNVACHPSKGYILKNGVKKIVLLHGHTWPAIDLLDADTLFMGHNHPATKLRDPLGIHHIEKVWIRTKWNKKKVQKYFSKHETPLNRDIADKDQNVTKRKIGAPEIIIFPAFHPLIKGTAFNDTQSKFLGPLFTTGCIEHANAGAYLTDGTHLGLLKTLYL